MKISLTRERKYPPKSEKHRVSYRVNPRRNTGRHMFFKLTKTENQGKILKAAKEKK